MNLKEFKDPVARQISPREAVIDRQTPWHSCDARGTPNHSAIRSAIWISSMHFSVDALSVFGDHSDHL